MSWLTSIFSANTTPVDEDDIHFSPLSLSRTPSSPSLSSSHSSSSDFEFVSPPVATVASTPAGKVSFLSALMRSKPENANNKKDDSPFVCYGAEIQRCPSTSTTPTGSLCASRCESPFSAVSSWSDEERKEYDFANSATVSDVESMVDSDDDEYDSFLNETGAFPSIAEEKQEEIEEEEEPFHHRHLWEDCEGEFPYASYRDSYLIHSHLYNHGRTSRMLISSSWDFDRSLKTRHKALTHFKTAFDYKQNNRLNRFHNARAIKNHLNPHSLTRLQEASTPVRHLKRRDFQMRPNAIPNPYQRPQSTATSFSLPSKHKNTSTASLRASEARVEASADKTSRRTLQRSARSLAARTRPAMANARTSAHQIVLINRAARKEQLKQPQKKKAVPVALLSSKVVNNPARKHTSRFFKQTAPHTTPVISRSRQLDVGNRRLKSDMSGSNNFDDFRREFYKCFRGNMEGCLDGGVRRVTNIRFCPINPASRAAFMHKLALIDPKESEIELVYHGTPVSNMQSICDRGLLAPTATSGIEVTHAASYHGQIYSHTTVHTAVSYAQPTCSTVFVCAVITAKCGAGWESFYNFDSSKYNCVRSGNTIAIQDARLIIPLFLLDFESLPLTAALNLQLQPSPHELAAAVARPLLRRAHDRQKRQTQIECNKQQCVY